jgi:hypothetical protein
MEGSQAFVEFDKGYLPNADESGAASQLARTAAVRGVTASARPRARAEGSAGPLLQSGNAFRSPDAV